MQQKLTPSSSNDAETAELMAATATSFMMIVYVASVGVGNMCRDRSDVRTLRRETCTRLGKEADEKTAMGHKILNKA